METKLSKTQAKALRVLTEDEIRVVSGGGCGKFMKIIVKVIASLLTNPTDIDRDPNDRQK